MKYGILVLASLVVVGCSRSSDPGYPLPEVRENDVHVYVHDGVEFPFPPVVDFDGAQWNREKPLWTEDEFFGYQYAHQTRPRKIRHMISHDSDGFTVQFQEGSWDGKSWTSQGKTSAEFPSGEWIESEMSAGQLHGKIRAFSREGGLLDESEYYHGKPHGTQKLYRKDGTLQAELTLVDGEIVETAHYNRNGEMLPNSKMPGQTKAWVQGKLERGEPIIHD
jgi:hypothetical protein